jgi:ABC-type transport system substrate-binding protein
MLLSTIVGSRVNVAPTKAETYPWEPLKFYATKTANLHWGYYGGYQALWAAMAPTLAEIGITLDTSFTTDDYSWWGRVWDVGWDKTHVGGGWDLTMLEWWLQPHSLVPWFESMVYGDMAPPEGYNIQHWNNTLADEVLRRAMKEHEADKKKGDMWTWQEVFMHDPPWADVYNPKIYEILASYLTGYNPQGCWWYDIKHLTINATNFYQECQSADRLSTGPNTTIYGVSEEVWSLLPVYMDSYTEEQMSTPQFTTLYTWSIKPEKWQYYMDGGEVNYTDWAIVPDLAVGDPIMLDGGTRARVVIRDDVLWSDETPLTVNDVLFTFNTCCLNIDSGCTGYGDFIPQLKAVEYYNETAVDFILQYDVPMNDLKSCLANDWGTGAIMPFHILGKYMDAPSQMRHDKSNTDFENSENWLPVTGPYKMDYIDSGNFIRFVKNDNYFGWDEGYGPHNIDTIIFKWVPNAETRLLELQSNDLDFAEYPTGSVDTFRNMENWTNVRVLQYEYPATNAVWFNLDHTTLSNRYVRQAISHAINYPGIIGGLLPSWGVEVAKRGLTHILDFHYYTDEADNTVHLYNDDLDVYKYNSTRALKYLEMWWYAKAGENMHAGPVGDANFNGAVDLYDYYDWVDWVGTPVHQIKFLPGQDIDPDWDNNGVVDGSDLGWWPQRFGFYYPENSTIHEWSR